MAVDVTESVIGEEGKEVVKRVKAEPNRRNQNHEDRPTP
jgi:hypothetical protein